MTIHITAPSRTIAETAVGFFAGTEGGAFFLVIPVVALPIIRTLRFVAPGVVVWIVEELIIALLAAEDGLAVVAAYVAQVVAACSREGVGVVSPFMATLKTL